MLRGTSYAFVLAPLAGLALYAGSASPAPAPPTPEPVAFGCHAQIGNLVWNDLDKDGLQGADEPGIAGVRVVLSANGMIVAETVTGDDGTYCFTDLCLGTYCVMVDESTLPAGFMPAMTDVGMDDEIDSDPNPTCVTLPDNYAINKTVDFGYCQGLGCRLTGGRSPKCIQDPEGNGWSTGGQIGAPTAEQPQPCGNWTHHQNSGPLGKFTFHAGTNSAPPETEIAFVVCSDPGNCNPSNAPAPVKQMNFNGIGTFKNVQSGPLLLNPNVSTQGGGGTPSLHYFEAYVFDGGEPGGTGGNQSEPGSECQADGFEGGFGLCSCPDYYRIAIHETTSPMSDVIYAVRGYLSSGNYQMHDPINGNTCD